MQYFIVFYLALTTVANFDQLLNVVNFSYRSKHRATWTYGQSFLECTASDVTDSKYSTTTTQSFRFGNNLCLITSKGTKQWIFVVSSITTDFSEYVARLSGWPCITIVGRCSSGLLNDFANYFFLNCGNKALKNQIEAKISIGEATGKSTGHHKTINLFWRTWHIFFFCTLTRFTAAWRRWTHQALRFINQQDFRTPSFKGSEKYRAAAQMSHSRGRSCVGNWRQSRKSVGFSANGWLDGREGYSYQTTECSLVLWHQYGTAKN